MKFMTEISNEEWASCNGGSRFQLDRACSDCEARVVALMLAFAAGKRVRLYINDGQSLPNCAPVVGRFTVLD
jgi:hypothetical protein